MKLPQRFWIIPAVIKHHGVHRDTVRLDESVTKQPSRLQQLVSFSANGVHAMSYQEL